MYIYSEFIALNHSKLYVHAFSTKVMGLVVSVMSMNQCSWKVQQWQPCRSLSEATNSSIFAGARIQVCLVMWRALYAPSSSVPNTVLLCYINLPVFDNQKNIQSQAQNTGGKVKLIANNNATEFIHWDTWIFLQTFMVIFPVLRYFSLR